MRKSDVITVRVESGVEIQVKYALEQGMRLSKIEGLSKEDLNVLIDHYVNRYKEVIIGQMGSALINHIPAFDRLCPICEGVLDCESDHK